jgi:hypothetical protein
LSKRESFESDETPEFLEVRQVFLEDLKDSRWGEDGNRRNGVSGRGGAVGGEDFER